MLGVDPPPPPRAARQCSADLRAVVVGDACACRLSGTPEIEFREKDDRADDLRAQEVNTIKAQKELKKEVSVSYVLVCGWGWGWGTPPKLPTPAGRERKHTPVCSYLGCLSIYAAMWVRAGRDSRAGTRQHSLMHRG